MEQMNHTLGGGAGETRTATPGRFAECEACTSLDALTEWINRDGTLSHLCQVCWVNVAESDAELETYIMRCDECETDNVKCQVFHKLNGQTFFLCARCFQMADHEDDDEKEVPPTSTMCECPLSCPLTETSTECILCKQEIPKPPKTDDARDIRFA